MSMFICVFRYLVSFLVGKIEGFLIKKKLNFKLNVSKSIKTFFLFRTILRVIKFLVGYTILRYYYIDILPISVFSGIHGEKSPSRVCTDARSRTTGLS